MKAKYFVALLIFFNCCSAFAQKEYNNWYFGKQAAITFNTPDGTPVSLNNSAMDQDEGCGTISDKDGNLLFYTNGINVYNSSHNVMPNGKGLYGNNTSTTSAFIVPKPGNANLYYIFTSDQGGYIDGPKPQGICYSIVDMRLDGGRGDVTSKNFNLFKPATEKITAIRHKNRHDVWIITHEWLSDVFRAYLLTDTGLVSSPVISHAGSVHAGDQTNTIGCMKASFTGEMLALLVYNGLFELFDFNSSDGSISLKYKVDLVDGYVDYGLEFSSDETKIYFTDGNQAYEQFIYQLDLNDVVNGKFAINRITGIGYYGSLQMGPDGRIYVAELRDNYLSAISDPNLAGKSCNFITNACPLQATCEYGLPMDVRGSNPVVFARSNSPVCEGSDIMLGFSLKTLDDSVKTYVWMGPNGFQSSELNPVIHNATSDMSGDYKITVETDSYIDSSHVYVKVNPKPVVGIFPSGPVHLCNGSTAMLEAKAEYNNGKYKYFWSTGDTSNTIIVNQPGTYSLFVIDSNGCVSKPDSVVVVSFKPQISILPADTVYICEDKPVDLECNPLSPGITDFKWSTGETTKIISVHKPGTYWVLAIDTSGCASDKDSVEVVMYEKENFSVSDLDMGSDCTGKELSDYLWLKNNGSNKVHISNIATSDSCFSIGSYPDFVNPHDSLAVPVRFNSVMAKDFNETADIQIDQPCSWSYTAKLTASPTLSFKAWFPDTSVDIKDKNFAIPLYVKLNCGHTINQEIGYRADICYDASAFSPNLSGIPGLVTNAFENNNVVLTIEGHFTNADSIGNLLLSIPGTVLLPDQKAVPLYIRKIESGSKSVEFITDSGSLMITGPCNQSLSRVKLFESPALYIHPNPARNQVQVILSTIAGQTVSLEVCSLQGIKLYTKEIKTSQSANEILIDISRFMPGLYCIVARSSSGTVSQPFVIVE